MVIKWNRGKKITGTEMMCLRRIRGQETIKREVRVRVERKGKSRKECAEMVRTCGKDG